MIEGHSRCRVLPVDSTAILGSQSGWSDACYLQLAIHDPNALVRSRKLCTLVLWKLALSQIHASICSPGRKHTTSAEPGRQANHAVDERAESAQMQVSHDRLDEPYREQRTAITGKQRLAVPGDDSGLKDRSRPESSCRCLWKPTTLELLGQGMHDLDSTKEQITDDRAASAIRSQGCSSNWLLASRSS